MANAQRKKKGGKTKKRKTIEQMVTIPSDNTEMIVRKKEAYFDFLHWDIMTIAEKKKAKQPKNQKEFAEKWDIRDATLSEWRARPDFEKLRSEMFRKKLAADVPEVFADMRKRIKRIGKADEVELWLAYSEHWDRKKVIEFKPPIEFGDSDIRSLIGKLPIEKQKLYRNTLAKLLPEDTPKKKVENSEIEKAIDLKLSEIKTNAGRMDFLEKQIEKVRKLSTQTPPMVIVETVLALRLFRLSFLLRCRLLFFLVGP